MDTKQELWDAICKARNIAGHALVGQASNESATSARVAMTTLFDAHFAKHAALLARVAELEARTVSADKEGRINAWYAVFATLQEVCPDWLEHEGSGIKKAVAAIRKLAAPAATAQPVAEAAAKIVAAVDDDQLFEIVSRMDESSKFDDGGQRARAAFEELCEFIDARVARAATPIAQPAAPVVREPLTDD